MSRELGCSLFWAWESCRVRGIYVGGALFKMRRMERDEDLAAIRGRGRQLSWEVTLTNLDSENGLVPEPWDSSDRPAPAGCSRWFCLCCATAGSAELLLEAGTLLEQERRASF